MENTGVSVDGLMTDDLVTATADTGIEEAAKRLLEHDIGSLVVVDSEGHLEGVLTSTDFLELATGEHDSAAGSVEQYMTTDVVSVNAHATLGEAAARMMAHDVQHLPVLDEDGAVVGMLSTTDLTAHLAYLDA
ncbi:HPP family protein [Haloarcula onubensis]|uniref:CBS domain-containing protein n=1 Tax=Haloarcula onubensis TaxID=2950539 RepID=A0ABU2FP39_9EURY|nr:CBS domain-containing protein [Halomicroarcula sp. S3CR25-11]MDS0282041.1 CBS domain-containing protein [Halomicroarcula sp. S3CR25-11]